MQPEEKEVRKFVVYVAGAFRDARIPGYIQRVQQMKGFQVTHDWTLERERPQSQAAAFDLEGVRRAHYVVAVMDYEDAQYDYRGTFTELGGALAQDKRVIVVHSCTTPEQYARTNCFFWHPQIVYVTSFDAALRLLGASRLESPRLIILGHGGHGKDTLAEEAREMGMSFASSSHVANAAAVYPTLRERYGYESAEQCFEDRAQHRVEWLELICAYNSEDRARLAKEIMRENQIYVGMRCALEFEASRSLFDLVVWVDATQRLPEPDPSLRIDVAREADVVIPNNETRDEYRTRIAAFLELLVLPPLENKEMRRGRDEERFSPLMCSMHQSDGRIEKLPFALVMERANFT